MGQRIRHRFVCEHGVLPAHSDLNASRSLARVKSREIIDGFFEQFRPLGLPVFQGLNRTEVAEGFWGI
jgi:hypothetical protein